jgi:multiple sugar transport system substrate-binding protein
VQARLIVGATLAALLLLATTGCGGDDDDDEAGGGGTVDVEQVSGNVTLAGWASSPTETRLLKQVITDFQAQYPNIKVKYEPISGDYPAAMLARFSARRPPDVFYVDSNVIPDWIDQDVLEPLDGYIESNDFDTEPFYDPLLDAFKGPGGETYGLPKDWSPLATFTNDALLEKAGVEPPGTWEELEAAAEKIEVPGGKPICLSADWARMLAFAHQNGGSFLNEEGTEVTVNSPEVKEAAEFYVGLVKSGLAAPPDKLGSGWCGEALGKQKAAIAFEGNWLVPFMSDTFPDVKYTISPMVENEQDGNLAFTVSYSMAADSKNKEAAWALLSYLTGPEGMETWTSQGLALPSREDVEPVEGRDAFFDAPDAARAWQFAPGFSDVIATANNEFTAVFEGKKTVDQMLTEVEQAAETALAS